MTGPLVLVSRSRFHEALRLTKAGLSDKWIQKIHSLVRKSSFSKAQGLRETGSLSRFHEAFAPY